MCLPCPCTGVNISYSWCEADLTWKYRKKPQRDFTTKIIGTSQGFTAFPLLVDISSEVLSSFLSILVNLISRCPDFWSPIWLIFPTWTFLTEANLCGNSSKKQDEDLGGWANIIYLCVCRYRKECWGQQCHSNVNIKWLYLAAALIVPSSPTENQILEWEACCWQSRFILEPFSRHIN